MCFYATDAINGGSSNWVNFIGYSADGSYVIDHGVQYDSAGRLMKVSFKSANGSKALPTSVLFRGLLHLNNANYTSTCSYLNKNNVSCTVGYVVSSSGNLSFTSGTEASGSNIFTIIYPYYS